MKYFDLRQNRLSDFEFSYERMLSPDGDTAVYLEVSGVPRWTRVVTTPAAPARVRGLVLWLWLLPLWLCWWREPLSTYLSVALHCYDCVPSGVV